MEFYQFLHFPLMAPSCKSIGRPSLGMSANPLALPICGRRSYPEKRISRIMKRRKNIFYLVFS